jgi:hypothetical protein
LDIMVGPNTELGKRIEADLLARANQFGIKYTLWQQAQEQPSGATLFMASRGGPTQDHRDHIHVRVVG